ncbi:uncharacterized protein BJ171DRAFT_586001 [Polychytrium aggregatum]|uniref:uncharacterized protein n=1 Tax=Polychytrium aggregatum TaxID=110093 RepID=UPI0022FE87AE|nr:uncharacterized protein BJ171DRAFT_586001 [Polychytrium aggregatum]KAI9197213.1 hypothetical protein BJ171DRAFT_586001 [Polychytrium aggregatum]
MRAQQDELARRDSEIQELSATRQAVEKIVDKHDQDIQEHDNLLKALKTDCLFYQTSINELRGLVKDAQTDNEHLRAECEAIRQENCKLKSESEAVERQNAALVDEAARIREQEQRQAQKLAEREQQHSNELESLRKQHAGTIAEHELDIQKRSSEHDVRYQRSLDLLEEAERIASTKKVDSLLQETERLRQRIESLVAECSQIEGLRNERQQLLSSISQLEARHVAAVQDTCKAREDMHAMKLDMERDIEATRKRLTEQLESSTLEMRSLKEEKADLLSLNTRIQAELDAVTDEHFRAVERYKRQNESDAQRIQSLTSQYAQLEDRLTGLREESIAERERLGSRIADLQEELHLQSLELKRSKHQLEHSEEMYQETLGRLKSELKEANAVAAARSSSQVKARVLLAGALFAVATSQTFVARTFPKHASVESAARIQSRLEAQQAEMTQLHIQGMKIESLKERLQASGNVASHPTSTQDRRAPSNDEDAALSTAPHGHEGKGDSLNEEQRLPEVKLLMRQLEEEKQQV